MIPSMFIFRVISEHHFRSRHPRINGDNYPILEAFLRKVRRHIIAEYDIKNNELNPEGNGRDSFKPNFI